MDGPRAQTVGYNLGTYQITIVPSKAAVIGLNNSPRQALTPARHCPVNYMYILFLFCHLCLDPEVLKAKSYGLNKTYLVGVGCRKQAPKGEEHV